MPPQPKCFKVQTTIEITQVSINKGAYSAQCHSLASCSVSHRPRGFCLISESSSLHGRWRRFPWTVIRVLQDAYLAKSKKTELLGSGRLLKCRPRKEEKGKGRKEWYWFPAMSPYKMLSPPWRPSRIQLLSNQTKIMKQTLFLLAL